MSNWKVYVHISPERKAYVGMTSQKIKDRWGRGSSYRNNKDFYADIQRYGWDNFEHEVIADCLNFDEACLLEEETIRRYNSLVPFGYNKSTGGEIPSKGCKRTAEQKRADSAAVKKRWEDEAYRASVIKTMKDRGIRPPSRLGVPNPHKKEVLQYTTDGQLIKSYPSVAFTAKAFGVTIMSISNACHGKVKTSCGFVFRFAE